MHNKKPETGGQKKKNLQLLSHFRVLNITFSQKHQGKTPVAYIFQISVLEQVFTEE